MKVTSCQVASDVKLNFTKHHMLLLLRVSCVRWLGSLVVRALDSDSIVTSLIPGVCG